MLVSWPRCSAECTVTPTSASTYNMRAARSFPIVCPVINQKLKAEGSLTQDEMDCLHLEQAADEAFHQWARRSYRP
jgi:hypothetical protein